MPSFPNRRHSSVWLKDNARFPTHPLKPKISTCLTPIFWKIAKEELFRRWKHFGKQAEGSWFRNPDQLREAYNPELLEDIKTKKLVEASFGCGLDGRDLEFSIMHLYRLRKKFFSLPKGSLDDYRDIDVEPEEFRAFLPSMNDLRKEYRSPDKPLNNALKKLYEEAWVERTTIVVSSHPIQHRKTLKKKQKLGLKLKRLPLIFRP
jgi:hypothetical protein